MTREEHKAYVNQLLGMVSAEHQADASQILTSLSEDYDQALATSESNATTIQNLTANNENLRKVNTELFLKVGHTIPAQNNNAPEQPQEKPMAFSELFNEKGELI